MRRDSAIIDGAKDGAGTRQEARPSGVEGCAEGGQDDVGAAGEGL